MVIGLGSFEDILFKNNKLLLRHLLMIKVFRELYDNV